MSCVALIMRSAEELSLSKEENLDADERLVHGRRRFVKLNSEVLEEVYVAEIQILLKCGIGLIPLFLCSNDALFCHLDHVFQLLVRPSSSPLLLLERVF